jgi:hypothetical protein
MKISGVFFCIVVLAFFMPFLLVKCGDNNVMKVNGMKFVTGGNAKLSLGNNMPGDIPKIGENPSAPEPEGGPAQNEEQKIHPKFSAVLAFLAAIIGLLYCFIYKKKSYLIPLALSIIGIIALIFLSSSMKSGLKEASGSQQYAGLLTTKMLFGYYLALLSFILAGAIAFLMGRRPDLVTEEKLRAGLESVAPGMAGKVDDMVDKVKDTVADSKIMDKVEGMYDKVKDTVADNKITEKVESLVDKVKETIGPDSKLMDKVDDVMDKVKDTVGADSKIGKTIDNVMDKVDDVIGPDGKLADKVDELVDKAKDLVDKDPSPRP